MEVSWRYARVMTALGPVCVGCSHRGVAAFSFGPRADAIFAGQARRHGVGHLRYDATLGQEAEQWVAEWLAGRQPRPRLDLTAIPAFSRQVLQRVRAIPYGRIRTYQSLAEAMGRPRSARAVGQAVARNPIGLLIPCHRVVGGKGDLCGFAFGGVEWKRQLLNREGDATGRIWRKPGSATGIKG